MSAPTVRQATPDDAPVLADFLLELGLFRGLEYVSLETLARDLKGKLGAGASHTLLVATGEGEIVGYAAAHWLPALFQLGPDGYVSELFVGAARRGSGVGKALLAAVEQEARERGCRRLTLLSLRDRESYRRGFYTAQGFREQPEAARFVKVLGS